MACKMHHWCIFSVSANWLDPMLVAHKKSPSNVDEASVVYLATMLVAYRKNYSSIINASTPSLGPVSVAHTKHHHILEVVCVKKDISPYKPYQIRRSLVQPSVSLVLNKNS